MKEIRTCLLALAIFMSLLTGYLAPVATAQKPCQEWVARVVSVQGSVQARKAGETQWMPVKFNDTYCLGDMIRIEERGRAALLLPNETILRLDQNTTVTFSGLEKERTSFLELLRGAAHFFSRTPRSLKVATPFVNGSVEGTEFFVRVERDKALLSVFEGRVLATNEVGSLTLTSGQSALAKAGQAPTAHAVIRPRDAVQWALYYPPILDYRPADFPGGAGTDWQPMIRRSIEFYWKGDLANAFSSLERAPEDIRDPRFFAYRAGLFLTVGRVDEAGSDIERALNLDLRNGHAFALQSIMAVVQNRKQEALELARKASSVDPNSAVAQIALSYAQQASFQLQEALHSLEQAVKLAPENALAWARLAELWLSVGNLDRALEAAQKAVVLNPNLARTQTVLGFSYLTQIKARDSVNAFEKAIELDQAAPLPRLGLGLARIREGELKAGREEIEIAASLDPNNSIVRSYLGKAYFEEKRNTLAQKEFAIAKGLDPLDPTPWFYDAIRKQTTNRPVEALQDLQKSIELNDNRAVYRSRMLLDDDLAARSASLARVYSDLGFQQLALAEGRKSLNIDPGNHSAHRFLADTYSALPRHEIARVSELLQSQLLQPINITPVQPSLAESSLFIFEGAGPTDPAFNEFNPLFNRNRFALQASGILGGNDTAGDEVVHSGVWEKVSYSLGQFHYETDGFRENNDLEKDIYNVFAQMSLSHKTSIQAEFRHTDSEKGDLELTFTGSLTPDLREKDQTDTIRFGLRHAFTPRSGIIASLMYQNADLHTVVFPGFFDLKADGVDHYIGEIRYLFQSKSFRVTGGLGHRRKDQTLVSTFAGLPSEEEHEPRYTNAYAYSQIELPKNFCLTVGGSADFFKGKRDDEDRDQFNPKLGLTWNPAPPTTFRAAVFRTLLWPLVSREDIAPSLEPAQVAGFNQFFFGVEGEEAWRYGIAVDHRFSPKLYAGAELSARDLEVPLRSGFVLLQRDWDEQMGRAYLYFTPFPWLALGAEYLYEQFKRDATGGFTGAEQFGELRTHRLTLGLRYFHPSGFSAGFKPTYVDQKGDFTVPSPPPGPAYSVVPGDDQFWVVDASIGYRLPKRHGLFTLEAKNLFDEQFNFQDTDPAKPRIVPDRLILLRFTLAF